MDGTGLNLRKAREDAGSAEVLANIEQDMADAKILNVTRTPGFFVNGKPLKDFGDEQLKALVSRELKGNIAMRWYQHSTQAERRPQRRQQSVRERQASNSRQSHR